MAKAGSLLHSCAVYLYLYDDASGSYTQQTDAAVGCALLVEESAVESVLNAFSLLLYDTQKTPLLQLSVTPSAQFVPQKDSYINFYERQTQRNYAMRFKDPSSREGFMSAVSYARAQVFVHASDSYDHHKPGVLVDPLSIGMEDAEPLTLGDVAGVTLRKWHGTTEERESFFSANPLEIMKQPTTEPTSDVKRIRLQEKTSGMDQFTQILATEALVGMQKMGKRLVTVTLPNTNEWIIAEVELVKVKKNKKLSCTSAKITDNGQVHGDREELVKRMASLSRMGSQTSGLLASVKTQLDSRASVGLHAEDDAARSQGASCGHQAGDSLAGSVPVLLAGLQLPGKRLKSLHSVHNDTQSQEAAFSSHAASLAPEPSSELRSTASSGTQLSTDMERLMHEQSDLARLREQLEASKQKLKLEDTSGSSAQPPRNTGLLSSLSSYKPLQDKPVSSFIPSAFALMNSSALPRAYDRATTNNWTPPNVNFGSSSLTPYNKQPFSSFSSVSGAGSSLDVGNGIIRLQRSSTAIESTLQDLQSKVDRLLNSQNYIKSTKYTTSASKRNCGASFLSSSTSSSSMLLKNVEKALAQRDQLQNVNSQLEETNSELESRVEELQTQHESLQLENRTLLDKMQHGNLLQQEKFRVELQSVQQQLSHTQEKVLMYQEENFKLRAQLHAKDEQLEREKTKLHDETQKQLNVLQRQVEDEVRESSKNLIETMASEKAALMAQVAEFTAQQKQWEVEREIMNNRLSQAQSQQVQLQDETVKSQAAHDSRVQELLSRVQQLESEQMVLQQQAEGFHSDAEHFKELFTSKEHEMTQLQAVRNDQEYAALSELFKEFMNDIYFHFQDAFEEDTEFTGREIVMAIRKILKQNTMNILAKLEEFYHQQARL